MVRVQKHFTVARLSPGFFCYFILVFRFLFLPLFFFFTTVSYFTVMAPSLSSVFHACCFSSSPGWHRCPHNSEVCADMHFMCDCVQSCEYLWHVVSGKKKGDLYHFLLVWAWAHLRWLWPDVMTVQVYVTEALTCALWRGWGVAVVACCRGLQGPFLFRWGKWSWPWTCLALQQLYKVLSWCCCSVWMYALATDERAQRLAPE